jgi:hypothetical protein
MRTFTVVALALVASGCGVPNVVRAVQAPRRTAYAKTWNGYTERAPAGLSQQLLIDELTLVRLQARAPASTSPSAATPTTISRCRSGS